MAHSLVHRILYKRRRIVTRRRLASVAKLAAELMPVVVAKKPGLSIFQDLLGLFIRREDNDGEGAQKPNQAGVKQRINALKAQLQSAEGKEAEALRGKINTLYELLLEEDRMEAQNNE
jgi:hypothetical protein